MVYTSRFVDTKSRVLNRAVSVVLARGVTSLGKMLGIRKIRGLNLHLRFGRVSLTLVVSNPSITKS